MSAFWHLQRLLYGVFEEPTGSGQGSESRFLTGGRFQYGILRTALRIIDTP